MHTTLTPKKGTVVLVKKQNSRRTFTPLKKSRNEWNAPVEMLITSHPEFGTANPNRTLSPNSKVSRHPTRQVGRRPLQIFVVVVLRLGYPVSVFFCAITDRYVEPRSDLIRSDLTRSPSLKTDVKGRGSACGPKINKRSIAVAAGGSTRQLESVSTFVHFVFNKSCESIRFRLKRELSL